jgi:hypothetical protein
MPFSFPSSPSVGATSTQNGRSYTYAGNNVWELTPAAGGSGLSWSSVPASATASGTAGSIAYDNANGFFYVATATDTWKRAALSTWAPFSPSSVTGLQLWLDASDGASLYDATTGGSAVTGSSAVYRWADKSGYGRHAVQSNSAYCPTRLASAQNGLVGVQFTGSSNHRLQIASSTSTFKFLHNSAYTMFFVAKIGTNDNPDTLNPLASTINTFSGSPGVAIYHDDRRSISRTNRVGLSVKGDAASDVLSFTTADSFFVGGSYRVLTITGNMASGVPSTMATLYSNGAGATSPTSTDASVSSSDSQADFTVGALASQFWLSGVIGEVCAYSGVLSTTDRQAVEAYLTSKWGIT